MKTPANPKIPMFRGPVTFPRRNTSDRENGIAGTGSNRQWDTRSMKKIWFGVLAFLGIANSQVLLKNEYLIDYPLLPKFYEDATNNFGGISVGYAFSDKGAVRVGWHSGFSVFRGPYSDMSYTECNSNLIKAELEYTLLSFGVADFQIAPGFHYTQSEWHPYYSPYDDPSGLFGPTSGRLDIYGVQLAPEMTLFKEKQKFDWSISAALPMFWDLHHTLSASQPGLKKTIEDDYLDDYGYGFSFSLNLGFNLEN
jgi:hypothetical protein